MQNLTKLLHDLAPDAVKEITLFQREPQSETCIRRDQRTGDTISETEEGDETDGINRKDSNN